MTNRSQSGSVRPLTPVAVIGLCLGLVWSPLLAAAEHIPWRNAGATPAVAAADFVTVVQAADGLVASSDGVTRHFVAQFDATPTETERALLRAGGVELLAYVGGHAYFAGLAGPINHAALTGVPLGMRVVPIQTDWKIHPFLAAGGVPEWAVVGEAFDGSPVFGAYVLFHPDVALDADGLPLVGGYAGVVRDVLRPVNGAVVELPLSQVAALAAEDGVQWIEPALPRFAELNDGARARVGTDTLNAAPYNLNGAGVTVLVYDGGTARASHQTFGGRLTTHDSSGLSSHATHVSGTIGGNGAGSAGNIHRGMAPGVTIVSYGFQYDGTPTFLYNNPGDIVADYTDAINNRGADISNNSIGTNTETNGFDCAFQGNYGVTDQIIDGIVRGSVSGGVPFRICWAGGNERQGNRCDVEGFGDYYSTAPPAGAKNHVCVGAINSNDDSMTSFSSWGPTDDGRLKPDITAPGCQAGGDAGLTSSTSTSDTSYGVSCGTSMACPTTTGNCALILQDYRAQFPSLGDPRNSTMKILLAHNAVDLGNAGPDYQFGYGSIRVQPTIDFMRTGNFYERSVSHGGVSEFKVNVSAGQPLKVTLAWDDYPGTPNVNPALVNDLDVVAIDPNNNVYRPWTLDPNAPSAAAVQTVANHRDNIEQIYVANPVAGQWRVQVLGFNVPQGAQPFSVCASPNIIESGIRIETPGGTPGNMTPGTGATFAVRVIAVDESLVGTPALKVRYNGGAYLTIPLTPVSGNDYTATLPPPVCGATPQFYITATGTVSGAVTLPATAPASVLSATVGTTSTLASINFETDPGWTVTNDAALTTGAWVRAVPIAPTRTGEPSGDYDGSGRCWITGNTASEDVDGGFTTLTSAAFDLSSVAQATVSFALYAYDSGNPADVFPVQVATAAGGPWTTVANYAPTGGWSLKQFNVSDFVPLTSTFYIRFRASDNPNNSVNEGCVDRFRIDSFGCTATLSDCNGNKILDSDDIASGRSLDANTNNVPDECEGGCPGDADGDNDVDQDDLDEVLFNFGTSQPPGTNGDVDGDGDVDQDDLDEVLFNFGTTCP